uniref:Uncharacterized protein n=1 Tax=Desertifilum tharense IPPAS B-1220 TaxID=1781255 RepID=A0ACD5GV75_9CYAN
MIGTRLLTLRSLDQNYSRDGKKGVGSWELGVGEEEDGEMGRWGDGGMGG